MTSKKKSEADLRRKRNTRSEKVTVLIVSEGERREPQYFGGLARHLRSTGVRVCSVKAFGTGDTAPMQVVDRACKETKNGRLVGTRDGYDSVWCVFDVDQHVGLPEAIKRARELGFNVAVSNPCFEIWLIWHFENWTRYIDRTEAKSRLKQQYGFTHSGMPVRFDYSSHSAAVERAVTHVDDMPGNPGSRVWTVVEELRKTRR